MNKLVKRGFSAYKIFLKNKVASSVMMLMSGVMMLIGGLQGKGNDLKSLPLLITSLGVILSVWAIYRFGYLKSNYDAIIGGDEEAKKIGRKVLLMQSAETLLYAAVAGLGVFLLSNENFTNIALNIMSGFFTTLNGVFGVINTIKGRENKDFRWKFILVLTIIELAMGAYFLIGCRNIEIAGYILMGSLTTVAGIIEVINAFTRENIRNTENDVKDIVHIMKDGKKPEEKPPLPPTEEAA